MQTHSSSDVIAIDVSNHQYDIDWQKVKAARPDIKVALLKSSEGVSYKDPFYIKNVQGAKSVGILVAPYHFGRPDEDSDAIAEAKFFVSIIKSIGFDLSPVLDVEVGNSPNLSSWIRTFIDTVKQDTGLNTILYTGNWFIDSRRISELTDIPLWVANYSDVSAPPDSGGWTKWIMWQYTDNVQIPGINGDVDMSYAVSIEALKTGVTPMYQTVKVQINGKPWMDGLFINGSTFVVWTALDAFGTPNEYKGNGLFNVNGSNVQGTIYNRSTYLPWRSLATNIQYTQIDGGYNFTIAKPQPSTPAPIPSQPTTPTTTLDKNATQKVLDMLSKVHDLSDTNSQLAIKYAIDSLTKAIQ